jgi:UDP-2,3-diacylglucosamine hydrolase
MTDGKLFFLSDVHLGAPRTEVDREAHRKLRGFLDHVGRAGQVLYIVGDFFDFWFEYRKAVPKQCLWGVHYLMKLLESGTEIQYLVGNHDCWMGDFFERELGVRVWRNPITIDVNGKKILLHHGDGVSDRDRTYRMLRRILRFPPHVYLYRWLHPDIGVRMANASSRLSRDRDRKHLKYVDDPSIRRFVHRQFDAGIDTVIMGHHHLPVEEESEGKKYINLGDWLSHFTYAETSEKGIALNTWRS